MSDVFSHPQFVANGMAESVEDPEFGTTTQVGLPAVLGGTPGAIQGGQPRVGQHSREVLAEVGYSGADIDGLLSAGAVEGGIAWAP
jgi:crotonobetainyl-CoA:carnitine CoA-transferase CaiB-like acyl-CoA transferase